MQLEKGYLYHIYNQGNNQRQIFFKRENYLFFLKKIETFILPYADILAWSLMSNHFHLMVLIRKEELLIKKSEGFIQNETLTNARSLNDSIGIMLRSYTRAINKQENLSGSLFRKKTKADCINCPNLSQPPTLSEGLTAHLTEKQYPQVCFNYIHQNPVKGKLVANEIDYEFSSARDYANLRNGKLINKEVAFEYIDIE